MRKKPSKNNLTTRGQTFVGLVTKISLLKNAHVEWERKVLIPKYERYEKRRSKVIAHIPDGVEVSVGDKVEIKQVRKISKTKNFIITKILK